MNFGSYRFNVGSFECVALSDGRFNYPVEIIFANVPEEEIRSALNQRGLSVDRVTTLYTCLLVDTGEHRVLIDTGAGNLGANAARLFPTVDHSTTLTGTLVENLRAIGIQPGDVDRVVITHAHPDHVGGTLDANGALVFAEAEYYIHQEEWAFWNSERAGERASPALIQIARHNLDPISRRLIRIEQDAEIVPGIRTMLTPGHTPGHMVVRVSSDGETLLNISDIALTPLHLEHPTWYPVFDIDPEQAAASKRQVIDRAASEHTLLFAHHLPPFPNLGYVVQQGEAWRWQPYEIPG